MDGFVHKLLYADLVNLAAVMLTTVQVTKLSLQYRVKVEVKVKLPL
jgi:hypothetical protein